MEDKEVKNKMITIKVSEKEKAEIEVSAKREQRSVANFLLWLVSQYRQKYGA
jgi:uncharacterized protein (DUF1778 family)